MKTSEYCKRLRMILMLAALVASEPSFAIDLLNLPAIQSGAATRALLLDAAPRGEHSIVAVGDHGVIIVSDDDGNTWQQATVPVSVALTAVYFPTAESGWAVGHDGVILHSADGGATWVKQLDGNQLNEQIVPVAERIVANTRARLEELQAQEEPDEAAIEDAEFMLEEAEFMLEGAQDDVEAGPVRPLLDVWFRNDREGFVAGSYGMLLYTDDGGKNWKLVSDRMNNAQAYHLNQITPAPDGNLYIAGEAGYVYRSADGGLSWDTLTPGYEGSFYGIVAAPSGDDGYELLAYGLRGNLFQSLDAGETWSSLNSGTPATLMCGALLRDGTVFLAGQGGTILTRAPGAQDFHVAGNPDRRVISGLVEMADGNVLLVGFGGVRKVTPSGMPLGQQQSGE